MHSRVVEQELLARIADRMAHFPGYAQIRRVHVTHGEWTVADGLLTPTMKLRRHRVLSRFAGEIDQLYEGH